MFFALPDLIFAPCFLFCLWACLRKLPADWLLSFGEVLESSMDRKSSLCGIRWFARLFPLSVDFKPDELKQVIHHFIGSRWIQANTSVGKNVWIVWVESIVMGTRPPMPSPSQDWVFEGSRLSRDRVRWFSNTVESESRPRLWGSKSESRPSPLGVETESRPRP